MIWLCFMNFMAGLWGYLYAVFILLILAKWRRCALSLYQEEWTLLCVFNKIQCGASIYTGATVKVFSLSLSTCTPSTHIHTHTPSQDFGYPQSTSTEVLKSYICNSPCPVTYESHPTPGGKGLGGNTLPSHAANKPIATSLEGKRDQKNEVFIDLLERLTVLVAANVSLLCTRVCVCVYRCLRCVSLSFENWETYMYTYIHVCTSYSAFRMFLVQ